MQHIPSDLGKVASTAFLPFDVKRNVSEDTYWIERAPGLLLYSAADAACRVGDGIKQKKSDVSTELGRRENPNRDAAHTLMTLRRLRDGRLSVNVI